MKFNGIFASLGDCPGIWENQLLCFCMMQDIGGAESQKCHRDQEKINTIFFITNPLMVQNGHFSKKKIRKMKNESEDFEKRDVNIHSLVEQPFAIYIITTEFRISWLVR